MNIYSFSDPVDFLEASYSQHKESTPSLSMRKWSAMIGLESTEILSEIFKRKKKISFHIVPLITTFLGLNKSEEKFFETLVHLSRATSNNEVALFTSLLNEQKGVAGEGVAIVSEDSIFTHWIHMAILSMSKIKGFYCTPDSVAELLLEEVPINVVKDAVERLIRHNLLEYDTHGSLRKVYAHTTTKNDVSMEEVHSYYRNTNELGRKAITMSVDEREFQCFSLSIRKEDLGLFKDAIRQFRFKIAAMTPENQGDQIYQCNIQFFPLTKRFQSEQFSEVNTADQDVLYQQPS